jgi:CBS domain-containing protein
VEFRENGPWRSGNAACAASADTKRYGRRVIPTEVFVRMAQPWGAARPKYTTAPPRLDGTSRDFKSLEAIAKFGTAVAMADLAAVTQPRRSVMIATLSKRPASLTLKARTAAELMSEKVVSISDDAPLAHAIAMLVDHGFSGAPVVDAAGRAVGVISLSDIVIRDRNYGCGWLAANTPFVRDVMTPAVCGVRPETPAAEVIEEMVLLRVRRLFVIDAEGVLVGVIAASDVVRHLMA